ncbi:hypothetical protein N9250_02655 [bacterium]|nr:hypothetical protein [bacterium]
MRLRKEPSRTVVVEGQGINTLQHAVPAPCRSSTLPFQHPAVPGENTPR